MSWAAEAACILTSLNGGGEGYDPALNRCVQVVRGKDCLGAGVGSITPGARSRQCHTRVPTLRGLPAPPAAAMAGTGGSVRRACLPSSGLILD